MLREKSEENLNEDSLVSSNRNLKENMKQPLKIEDLFNSENPYGLPNKNHLIKQKLQQIKLKQQDQQEKEKLQEEMK